MICIDLTNQYQKELGGLIDEENSNKTVNDKLKKELLNGNFLQKVDVHHFNELLADDDFLGLQYFRTDTLKQGQKIELPFNGRHLFDRYEYTLILDTNK